MNRTYIVAENHEVAKSIRQPSRGHGVASLEQIWNADAQKRNIPSCVTCSGERK
jgi:hypothetical protein